MTLNLLRRLLAFVLSMMATVSPAVLATDPVVAAAPEATAVATMMGSYDARASLIGPDDWGAAVAMSALLTYEQSTGDTRYDAVIERTFARHRNSRFENSYMDDTGWWGLVWLQAYDVTGNHAYLGMAKQIATYIHAHWDGTCGGGVWWRTNHDYKNAITNELFLQLTAGLHNRTAGDRRYRSWAEAEWRWFSRSGLINGSHLVNDGLTSHCRNNRGTTWTYNQGVIVAALAEFAAMGGHRDVVATGTRIADAATRRLTVEGVLVEPCEPVSCGADGRSFKGIFVRGLKSFATATRTSRYDAFFRSQAAAIVAHDMNAGGQIGTSWAGPLRGVSTDAQVSGVDALVAARPASPRGQLRAASARQCVDVRSGSRANGTSVQLYACNRTPAQSWTARPDGTMRALGSCLDVGGGRPGNGTRVQLWECNGTPAQHWERFGDGYRNGASGRCLDVPRSATRNGTRLQLFDCNGTRAQTWSHAT